MLTMHNNKYIKQYFKAPSRMMFSSECNNIIEIMCASYSALFYR